MQLQTWLGMRRAPLVGLMLLGACYRSPELEDDGGSEGETDDSADESSTSAAENDTTVSDATGSSSMSTSEGEASETSDASTTGTSDTSDTGTSTTDSTSSDSTTDTSDTGDTGQDACAEATAPDCGANGMCVVNGGIAECECDRGYAGETCTECGLGYSPSQNGCIADCGTCTEAHEVCNPMLEPPACDCAPGYAKADPSNPLDPCVWGGLPDPLFTEGIWQASVATIDPMGFGADNGSARLTTAGLCGLGSIAQTVLMPPYAAAEPLMFELDAYRIETSAIGCYAGGSLRIGNASVSLTYPETSPATVSACLGEAGYGGAVDFAMIADIMENETGCFEGGSHCAPLTFREVRVRTATMDECPPPSVLTNADFSAGSEGWTFAASGTGAVAEVQNGQAVLSTTTLCSSVSVSKTISFPLRSSLPNQALTFDVVTTDDHDMVLSINDRVWGSVIGIGGNATATYCVPDYVQGMAADVKLQFASGGACASPDVMTYRFDNFALGSDPACDPSGLVDGGFEAYPSTASASGWALNREDFTNNDGWVEISDSSLDAHAGNGSLHFWSTGMYLFSGVEARTSLRVPLSQANAGPAVRFWARAANADKTKVFLNPLGFEVPQSDTWTQHEVCLDGDWGGQIMQIAFSLEVGSVVQVSDHFIDDVELVHSESCPP